MKRLAVAFVALWLLVGGYQALKSGDAQGGSAPRCGEGTKAKPDKRFDDLGIHEGYDDGRSQQIRLCALTNLSSSSEESNPNDEAYISGAEGHAIVRAEASMKFYRLVAAAKKAGKPIAAKSSFRTMEHQKQICRGNGPCRRCYEPRKDEKRECNGDSFDGVAKPGQSNHQQGTAIDFNTSEHPEVFTWLNAHADEFGISNYKPEKWHWSTTGN